jgi:putative ABC transport system permease protein
VRPADVLRIALTALVQQKVRTCLTLAGVLIGSFALAVSLSLARGFEAEVMRQLTRRDQLRQVVVWPSSEVKESDLPAAELQVPGDMEEAKRQRLRKAVVRRFNRPGIWPRAVRRLTPEQAKTLAAIEHVESVQPLIQLMFVTGLEDWSPSPRTRQALGVGVAADDREYRHRIVAGDFLPADERPCLVIGEYLLYRWGITSETDVSRVVGRTLHLEYHPGGRFSLSPLDFLGIDRYGLNGADGELIARALKQLPTVQDQLRLSAEEKMALARIVDRLPPGSSAGGDGASSFVDGGTRLGGILAGAPRGPFAVLPFLYVVPANPIFSGDFTIVGVFRETTEEDDSLYSNLGSVSQNADLLLPCDIARQVFLAEPRNRELGYQGLVLLVDREENVKQVSQQVKAMGLREFSLGNWMQRLRTNLKLSTFVTSFLAVVALLVACLGITNTMIMSVLERLREIGIMKAVGARDWHIQLIFLLEGALIGGMGGVGGILCSWFASFAGDSTARQLLSEQNEMALKGTLFVFPWWLTLGVPLFACLVTTLAALYPARRASRVDPIAALRHE